MKDVQHILLAPKHLAIGLLILMTVLNAEGQNTGNFGKKFIVKANVINGRYLPFNEIEAEYAAGRKLTLFASFNRFDYGRSESGHKARTGLVKPRGNGEYKEFSILKNGNTTGSYYGIGAKIYFNRVIPAPYGWYMSFYAGMGKASYSDYTVSYEYKAKLTNFDPDGINRADATGINGESRLFVAELPGFGFQRIYRHLICLDLKFGLLTQYSNLPDNMLNVLEHNYYVRSNTVSYAYGRFSTGLNLQLKLGLLLF